jgi:magnesium chelatase family protein
LEDKIVTNSRASGTLTFPANFMLIAAQPKHGGTQAAMNPCPCGYFGDPVKDCTCSPMMITRYRPTSLRFGDSPASPMAGLRLRSQHISGPLMDRSAQSLATLKTLRSLSLCEIDIHVEVPRVEYDPALPGQTASWRTTAWASPARTSAGA